MGFIRKRGDSYQVRVKYNLENGKQKEISRTCKTSREAKKILAELEDKVYKGQYFEAEKMSLNEYLTYWLKTYAQVNVAASTYKRYNEFSTTIINYIGNIKLNQLKPAHIQKFYSDLLKEKKLSNSTILKIHRMLHIALKHAVGWQMLNYNPSDAVTPPRAEKKEMKVWNEEQIKEFLNKADPNSLIYMPAKIALATGMREGEICALKWDCVDFKNKNISVKFTMQNLNKNIVLKPPKTKKSIRTIAISDSMVHDLKQYKKKQLETKLLMSKLYDDNGYVCTHDDGKPITPRYLTGAFPKLLNQLGLYKIRFHDLRHTHATLLLKRGIPAKVVSERLGHSTISITLDIYSHVLPNMQKEAAERINDIF